VTDCIELATRLGKAIADSPQAAALRAARDVLNARPEIAAMLQDYHQQAEKVAKLEEEQQPVEVEDKHKLQSLNDQLVSSDAFKQFQAAQVDYVDLMRKVDEALRKELAATEQ